MKDCIDEVGTFLTSEEINDLSEKVIKLLMESDKRKGDNETCKKEDDVEEEERDLLEEDNKIEEELHVSIAELIGILFKTHKEQTINLANLIYKDILPKVLDKTQTDRMHKFGMFLIDDMVEFMGF